MTDFCENHEYTYAGDECPICEYSIGFRATDVKEDIVRDAIQSAAESAFGMDRREQVWTVDSRFYRFAEHLTDHLSANLDAVGECQEPDRDTVVACGHGTVCVQTADGESITTSTCRIGSDDINDDGTVSTPLTGQCRETDRSHKLGSCLKI